MAVSGSIIDIYAQGEYAYRRLNRGILPKIGPEKDTAVIRPIVFGQAKTHDDDTPFQDLGTYNPVSYINDEQGTQTYSAIIANVDLREPYQLNGVLEPLTIRSKISMTSVDFPYEAHDTFGSFMAGNEDGRKRTDVVKQFFEVELPSTIVPFIDSDEYFGDTTRAAVKIPGILSSQSAVLEPFEEQDAVEYDKLGVTLTDSGIINALETMQPPTDDLLPNDHKAAGSGFTYTDNTAGTDSIAFGGLKR